MNLQATSCFEGGNAHILDARVDADGAVVVFAAQHKRGGPQACWFYFRVTGCEGPRLRCVLKNPSQTLGSVDHWSFNRPVYRVGAGPWTRTTDVRFAVNDHSVPEVEFSIPVPPGNAEPIEVAMCYPYLTGDLRGTLNDARDAGVWKSADIGYTPEGRPIARLYNSTGNESGNGASRRPGVYFIARQHSGETPGSWVLDGILRHLASPGGREMSNALCVWSVPFADPDGVADGAYGKDQAPWDLNRAWGRVKRPEIHAIQSDVNRWTRQCEPRFVIDLHAPSHHERGFYFWAPTTPKSSADPMLELARRYRSRVPEPLRGDEPAYRVWGVTDTSVQPGQSCIAYVSQNLGIPVATLEISYQGPTWDTCYTQDDYRELGRILIETIYDFIKG